MIELRDVTFSYGEGESPGLADVSLRIRPGETVVLCGESGCGKSTLARLVNGLIPHFYDGELSGEVLLGGRSVAQTPLYELAQRVGSVFQNPRTQFYNVESTAELAFGCENQGLPPEEIEQRIAATAERFDLGGLLDRNLFEMSGGEKQLIACGSVDTVRPEALVLDEPSSNLDLPAIRSLAAVVRRWKQDGRTIVIAEHRTFYLTGIADRFVYLRNGRIECEFTPEEFTALPAERLEELGLRAPEPWRVEPGEWSASRAGTVRLRDFECVAQGRRRLSIPELSLPRGEVIAVVGRNGAGKTTFARTLCALEKRSRGTLEVAGSAHTARSRRELVYMVMQDVNHQLFTEDVLGELMLSMSGADPEGDEASAHEILRALDLDGKADRHPMSLSGGEKQRVAIGSAIAADREFIVLDEPTSGLDHRHMREVSDALQMMSAQGKTLFVITHDIELILSCCSHVMYIEAGRVSGVSEMDAAGALALRDFFG